MGRTKENEPLLKGSVGKNVSRFQGWIGKKKPCRGKKGGGRRSKRKKRGNEPGKKRGEKKGKDAYLPRIRDNGVRRSDILWIDERRRKGKEANEKTDN